MRVVFYVIFLSAQVLFFGCNPKYGAHEIVYVDEQNKTSDDVYILFLTDQIDKYPQQSDHYLKLASIYKKQNKRSKAIALLQKAEKENPESIDVLIGLSSYYLENEDIEKLSKAINTIRKIDPDNMDFLKLSAGYSLLRKDYKNAVFFANRAILANPFDDENLFLRGSAQLINKDSLSALISFEEAYGLKNSYKNFSRMFDVALATESYDKAGQYLAEFAGRNTTSQLCYEWGAFYNETGKQDTAKMILMKCLSENPGEPRTGFELAKIYFRSNMVDSTLFYVDQFLETKPKGTEAYVLKARALEKISHYTGAREIYTKALKIDSTSILARKGLENLERKVAYLRLKKRKEDVRRQTETLKPLDSKVIN